MSDEFNLNGNVWVKVTEIGRRVYAAHWGRLGIEAPELQTDADGWSRFQLWELMNVFGACVYNGCRVPIETTISMKKPKSGSVRRRRKSS